MSVEQALLGFTRNGAYGWFREDRAGAVEVGKWADWVVLDRDVLEDEIGKGLRDVVIKETWVGGRRVCSDENREEGWVGRAKEVVRDPLTEMIVAVKELIEALARLVEAITGLLKVLMEMMERRVKVLTGRVEDEL